MKLQSKVLSMLLAAFLVLSTFGGCTGSAAESTQEPAAEPGSASSAAAGDERIPISIISGDYGRIVKEDNPVVEEVGKRTGTLITQNVVPNSEFAQKLNLLVASDTLPDIVRFNSYEHFQYISTGALLELTEGLSRHPDLKAVMPQEAWDLLTVNGEIYSIPNYNVPGKYSYYMRQDWLDNLSLDAPADLEQLREVLKAFTFNDPDGNGKDDTYGLASSEALVKVRVSVFMPIFGAYGIQPTSYFERDGKAYMGALTEEYKQALEFCRVLYMEDKVVDPDVFIIQNDQARQNIVNGRVGTTVGWWSLVCELLNDQLKMKEIDPESEWLINNEVKGPNGDYGMVGNDLNPYTTSISASSPHAEKCFELLEYLCSDEGFMLSSYGIEGVHYTVDADGNYEDRTDEGREAMNDKWLDILSQMVFRVHDYQDLILKSNPSYRPHHEGARDAKLYMNLFEGISTEESQKYQADLEKVMLDWMVKFITGKEPIEKFDDYVAEFQEKGGDLVMESYIAEYNTRRGTNLTSGH